MVYLCLGSAFVQDRDYGQDGRWRRPWCRRELEWGRSETLLSRVDECCLSRRQLSRSCSRSVLANESARSEFEWSTLCARVRVESGRGELPTRAVTRTLLRPVGSARERSSDVTRGC